MPQILLFNLSGKSKTQKLRFILVKLGIRARHVTKEEYGQSVGYLAGLEGFAERPEAAAEDFSDEMMVLCGFNGNQISALSAALRRAGAPVSLKAVLTETNAGWTPAELHGELILEREALESTGESLHKQ